MMQTIEQTFDEKFKMYKRCKKKELIKMLIESNRILDSMPVIGITYNPPTSTVLTRNGSITNITPKNATTSSVTIKPPFLYNHTLVKKISL